MKTRKIQIAALMAFVGTGAWMLSSCEDVNVTQVQELAAPKLASTPADYSTGSIFGSTFSIKDILKSNAFNKTGGFGGVFIDPNFGNPDPELSFAADLYSNASVELGRVLFYDKKLSLNNTIACGSCHVQSAAFSDKMPFSTGFAGRKTTRNSMAICNPVFLNNMFWDSRAAGSLDLSTRPVFNHIEMGMEDDAMLESKLSALSYYPALFEKAYGDSKVTKARISMSISHFLSSMVTGNSKFDQTQVQNSGVHFTDLEKMGADLFFSDRARCSRCHAGQNFSAPDNPGNGYGAPTVKGTANIGLERIYLDNGKENGKFRIPSLRNVELSGPYMHDGRFATLEQVIEHYSRGIQPHSHLDENLKDAQGNPIKLNFSAQEKEALLAFLRTLTDYSFLQDKRFSNPFLNN